MQLMYLLVHTHSIKTVIHNVDPAILGGEHKQGHQSLENSGQTTERKTVYHAYPKKKNPSNSVTYSYTKRDEHQTCRYNTCEHYLSKVVKVVLMVDPLVVGLQTVRLVGDVFDIGAEAVEELAFKQLSVEEQ